MAQIKHPVGRVFSLALSGLFLVVLFLSSMSPIPAGAATKGKYLVYVGTYTEHGGKGIYAYNLDANTGQVSALGLAAETANPSFFAVDASGHFLYAVNEIENYRGQAAGGVSAFAIDQTSGKLSLLNDVSSRDGGPAHITLDQTGKFVLVSNYTRGSVAVLPVLKDGKLGESLAFVQHHGSSVNKERQEGPHAHAVALSPDNRFALVADLGLDQVLAYPFDAGKGTLGPDPNIARTAPGSGPRHLVFSPNGKLLYVINELTSTVTTYAYDSANGGLRELNTLSTLPDGFSGQSTAAEIVVDPAGRFLYASNRGYDSIAVFSIASGTGALSRLEIVPVGGKTPRNFAIDPTGNWLLVGNQDSNNLVVFRINHETGRLTPTGPVLQVLSPAFVKFVPLS
jgi:6-phosphogluconolactonase